MSERIYYVADKATGKASLVRASQRHEALFAVMSPDYEIRLATQDELIGATQKNIIEAKPAQPSKPKAVA
jgi:hypothetical protein